MGDQEQFVTIADKVYKYGIKHTVEKLEADWKSSCYMLGALAGYRITSDEKYLQYALRWARENDWKFYVNQKGPKPHYKNADNITCAQIYLPLMEMTGEGSDQSILEELSVTLEDGRTDYWKWCDLVHMGLPVYHMFANKYSNPAFAEKGYALFMNCKNELQLYDKEEHLWYRDSDYLPDKKLTPSGKKIFWGRGQGWVLTGLVRALELVEKDSKYYQEYSNVLRETAEALLPWQQEEGMWRCSIFDPEQYDIPETSATVLISYALAKGIELGILEREKYLPCVLKAFHAMVTICLNEEGRLGYVQGVAGWPGPVYQDGTEGYAIGSFVCLCEVLLKL